MRTERRKGENPRRTLLTVFNVHRVFGSNKKTEDVEMRFLPRRLKKLFGGVVLSSLFFCILARKGFLPGNTLVACIASAICLVGNLVWQFYCLRVYRYCVPHMSVYYKTNICAALILCGAGILCSLFLKDPYYAYFMLPFKLFFLTGLTGKFVSALIVGALFLIEVPVAEFTVVKHPERFVTEEE